MLYSILSGEIRSLSVGYTTPLRSEQVHRTPLLSIENNGGHTALLGELLADLPSCLDSNNKLHPLKNTLPSRETTPTPSLKMTPSKGLLDYWSPRNSNGAQTSREPLNCKKAQSNQDSMSNKRLAQTASSLPEVKRQRRCNGHRSSPPNNHNMISDYMITNTLN